MRIEKFAFWIVFLLSNLAHVIADIYGFRAFRQMQDKAIIIEMTRMFNFEFFEFAVKITAVDKNCDFHFMKYKIPAITLL